MTLCLAVPDVLFSFVVSSPITREPDQRHRYASIINPFSGLILTLRPERLIRATRLHMPAIPLRLSLRVVRQRYPVAHRASHTLVATRLLHSCASSVVSLALGLCIPQASLVVFVVRVATAGAAADTKEPEERRADGKYCCKPSDSERVGADFDFDVVGVEGALESAGENAEEDA